MLSEFVFRTILLPPNHLKKERVPAKGQRDFQQEKRVVPSHSGMKLYVAAGTTVNKFLDKLKRP
jgi:hypothetical protein